MVTWVLCWVKWCGNGKVTVSFFFLLDAYCCLRFLCFVFCSCSSCFFFFLIFLCFYFFIAFVLLLFLLLYFCYFTLFCLFLFPVFFSSSTYTFFFSFSYSVPLIWCLISLRPWICYLHIFFILFYLFLNCICIWYGRGRKKEKVNVFCFYCKVSLDASTKRNKWINKSIKVKNTQGNSDKIQRKTIDMNTLPSYVSQTLIASLIFQTP